MSENDCHLSGSPFSDGNTSLGKRLLCNELLVLTGGYVINKFSDKAGRLFGRSLPDVPVDGSEMSF